MSCKPTGSLVEAAVCTLIKEIVAAYEARRRERRVARKPDDPPPDGPSGR